MSACVYNKAKDLTPGVTVLDESDEVFGTIVGVNRDEDAVFLDLVSPAGEELDLVLGVEELVGCLAPAAQRLAPMRELVRGVLTAHHAMLTGEGSEEAYAAALACVTEAVNKAPERGGRALVAALSALRAEVSK